MSQPPTVSLSSSPSSPDQLLKDQFERCRQNGVLRNDPLEPGVLRKRIPGGLHLIAEYEPTLFGRKRPAALANNGSIDMDQPFDKTKFNFTKIVGEEEVLVYLQTDNHTEERHPILVNVSPLMYGHGLLVPWVTQGLPQQLTFEAVDLALKLVWNTTKCDFCVGFNSLGAFSSVNHLHLHILYPGELDHEARGAAIMEGRKDFPIAYAPVKQTVIENYYGVCVDLLDWMVPCFSFQQKGVEENENNHNLQSLPSAVSRFVRFLHAERIPHNVLFLQEERVIVIPRQPQHEFDASQHGFNAALGEISGMLIAKTREHFEALEETKVMKVMTEHVACNEDTLSNILKELKKGTH